MNSRPRKISDARETDLCQDGTMTAMVRIGSEQDSRLGAQAAVVGASRPSMGRRDLHRRGVNRHRCSPLATAQCLKRGAMTGGAKRRREGMSRMLFRG